MISFGQMSLEEAEAWPDLIVARAAFMVGIGEAVLVLCRHIVGVGRRSSIAVDEALAHAYRTWTRLGSDPAIPGWFDARRAIDAAVRGREFESAVESSASDAWADLLQQLERLRDLGARA